MTRSLRVLIVEDSENDALLLLRELKKGGYEPAFLRVDDAETLNDALDHHKWDVVVCDFRMPHFDGEAALELFKKKSLNIPFIVVSGMIGEDVAVEMMRAGAHDYILKNNLARLVPAIDRELREAEERRSHRRAEEARSHLAAIVESTNDGIISTLPEGLILSWNGGAERMFGYSPDEAIGQPLQFILAAADKPRVTDIFTKIIRGERVNRIQIVSLRKDLKAIDISLTISAIKNSSGRITAISAVARDITERKRAEAEREKLLRELQDAVAQIKTLSGLLPICASCKKIRDDGGYWHQVEVYIQRHSHAAFTHGFCPDCIKRLYPDYAPEEEPSAIVNTSPQQQESEQTERVAGTPASP